MKRAIPPRLLPSPVSFRLTFRRKIARCVVIAFVACNLACASNTPPSPTAAPSTIVASDLEVRALLLLLADRLTYDPITFSRALQGGPEQRRQLAYALNRIGDRRGGAVLEGLLGDDDPSVRQVAAFCLGELGETKYPQGSRALLGAVHDEDLRTGRLAVEALGKIGVPLQEIVPRLSQAPSDEILARLVPSLFRFEGPAVLGWSAQGLASDDPSIRAMAAYGVARNPQPESVGLLRTLLDDSDPWIRGWGARALGQVGDRSDVDGLRPLLDASTEGPIIQALRAIRRLVDDGKTAAPESWRPRLMELLEDPRHGVRLTAIEASTVWLLDETLGERLGAFVTDGRLRERELALLALVEGGDARGALLTVRAAAASQPSLRRRAAEAAALLGSVELLEQLADDTDPGVRQAVLEVRVAASDDDSQVESWLRHALQDADPAVRASALDALVERPLIEMEALAWSAARSRRDRILDARLSSLRALAKRAAEVPQELGAVLVELEEAAKDKELLIRRQAIRSLAELGQEPPKVGSVATRRPLQVYREIARQTSRPRLLRIDTDRGTLRVQLACAEAPLTCLNFVQLASQGFYEGLTFHRVVPDFVVQTGDPRGDGSGGPGYTVRDEINLLRYDEGVLGMALSGPDTGGSQFFITLSQQPHLDGGYTAFGRVIDGLDVLPRIVQGDRILKITEIVAR